MNRYRHIIAHVTIALIITTALALVCNSVWAETNKKSSESKPKPTFRPNGVRFDGTASNPVHISSHGFEVSAVVLAFDYFPRNMRAIGRVKLQLNFTDKSALKYTHVETTSDSATLDAAQNQLILHGNVKGFYQVNNGTHIPLAGNQVVLNHVWGASLGDIPRQPCRYLIPGGYTGWVIVEYNVKGAPPLPIEDGYYVFKFPRDGRIQTSSTMGDGVAIDKYFYVTPKGWKPIKQTGWGGGGLIWAGIIGTGVYGINNKNIYTPPTLAFFVGTEKQLDKAGMAPSSLEGQKLMDEN